MPVGGCRLRSMRWPKEKNFWMAALLVLVADMVAGKVDGCSWADMAVGGSWIGIDGVVVGYMVAEDSRDEVGMTDCFGGRNDWLGGLGLPPLLRLSCKEIFLVRLREILQLWHKGLGFSLC